MKWLEIIELRSTERNRASVESKLQKLTNEVNKETERRVIKVYSHVALDSDFSIHLIHDSKEADINGSSLGLNLVSTLKEFGLINHSVWTEEFSK